MAKSPAWTRSEGKNPEGGLNEKGRASLRAAGHDIKRPQPEGGSRKDSFCARMKGMRDKNTSSETAKDPDSRINKSLRKWNCKDGGVIDGAKKISRRYRAEGGPLSEVADVARQKLIDSILRKNKQSKTPSSSNEITTPYDTSPATPKISKEQYMKGTLGRGNYALASGGAARKRYAVGGQSTGTVDDAAVLPSAGVIPGADPRDQDYLKSISNSVNSLYKTYLGWDGADQGGLQYWTGLINDGVINLDDLQNTLLNSDASRQYSQSNPEQFVTRIFQQELGRPPAEGGLQFFKNALASGAPPSQIISSIQGTEEAQNYQALNNLYRNTLGRDIRDTGREFWQQQLSEGNVDLDDIEQTLRGTQEGIIFSNKQDLQDTFSGYGISPSASQINQYMSDLRDGTKTLDQIDTEISRMPDAGTGEYIAPYQVAGGNVVPRGIPTTPARYREFITQQLRSGSDALAQYAQPILNMIAQGEGGYNSMNQGTRGRKIVGSTHDASTILGKDLRDFTIGEIMRMQEGTLNSGRKLFAAGMFQIIPKTMRSLVNTLGLDPNQKFDETTQQKLGVAGLLLKPNLGKYLLGASGNSRAAQRDLAQQWASFPDPRTGRSFYGGANRSGHTIPQVSNALAQSRSQFGVNFMPAAASQTPAGQGSSATPITTPTTTPTTAPVTIPTQPGAPNANDEASQEQFLQGQGIGGDLVAPGTTSFPISGIGGGGYQDPGVFGGNYTDVTSGAIAPSVPHTVTSHPVTHTPVTHTGGSHTSTGGGGSYSVGYAPDAGAYGGHHASGHGAVDPYFGHSVILSGSNNPSWYEQDRNRGMYGTDAELDAMKKRGGRINKDTGGSVKNAMDVARAYKKGGPVWDKPRPKSLGKPTPLSSDQKASAKASAKAAGRPYPNLVDNMRAARKD